MILTNQEAKRFPCGLVAPKGDIAARLLERLAETPELLETLTRPETDLLGLLGRASEATKPPATRPEQTSSWARSSVLSQHTQCQWSRV
jgi:hypothetical protein